MQNTLTAESEGTVKKTFGAIATFILLIPVPWMGAVIGVGLLWDQIHTTPTWEVSYPIGWPIHSQ